MKTTRFSASALLLFALGGAAATIGCSSDEDTSPAPSGGPATDAGAEASSEAGPDADAGDAGADADAAPEAGTAVSSIPLSTTVQSSSVTGVVDVVRDEHGVPHIYGSSLPDVAYAQGWVTAHDRWVQMDVIRHSASGTVTELFGGVAPSVFDSDVRMRSHKLRVTAEATWNALVASSDPDDVVARSVLTAYAAGVNAYLSDLKAGKYSLPSELGLFYSASGIQPWSEIDSLLMGNYQAFSLAFDADSEIQNTNVEVAAATAFPAGDPDPGKAGRSGIAADLTIMAPVDPTYTIDGWTGMNGDTSTAMAPALRDGNFRALLDADARAVRDLGNDHTLHPSLGSNNWIVGPQLTKTGHTIVANDTHLSLTNPAVFHLVHLVSTGATDPIDAMGVAFPGIPAIILGMTRHTAWGATVNNIDVTDIYSEQITACAGSSDPCVTINGQEVKLTARKESFKFGLAGTISKQIDVTMYEVPNHGPLIVRPTASHDGIEPIGATELSVKYTGNEPAPLFGAVIGLVRSNTVQDAKAALDKYFTYGGQNWVIGDDQGNFGWTEVIRVPRRAAGHAPWKVLPGDGSAEWGADLDPTYIPHAWNPAKGFLATANADPIGVTDDGDPFFGEPVVGGAPLYLGWNYDPGTRVGRITKRLEAATANGGKVGLDDMQSIQADDVSEWAEKLAPTMFDALGALSTEWSAPGSYAELGDLAANASADAKAILPALASTLTSWQYAMPSGDPDGNPTQQEIADSQAALVWGAWVSQFAHAALEDELSALDVKLWDGFTLKLLSRACNEPGKLATGIAPDTNDPWIFDDLGTQGVIESKRQIAARALLATIDELAKQLGNDPSKWTWGKVHTLALEFLAPVDKLRVPLKTDPKFGAGFPRHGGIGTVDVADYGLSTTDFSYSHGPAIRFVCDLDPAGPKARNVLPGGEIFDPKSPHYKDQIELWRKNQSFDLAFQTADVLSSANKEYTTNQLGRVRFQP